MFSIKIDASDFLGGLSRLPALVAKELRTEMKIQVTEIQRESRKNHRFKTRTGMLEKSVDTRVYDDGRIGEVGFDVGIADYGKYIEAGHAKPYDAGGPLVWDPDPFIETAAILKEDEIKIKLEEALKRGIAEAGLA